MSILLTSNLVQLIEFLLFKRNERQILVPKCGKGRKEGRTGLPAFLVSSLPRSSAHVINLLRISFVEELNI